MTSDFFLECVKRGKLGIIKNLNKSFDIEIIKEAIAICIKKNKLNILDYLLNNTENINEYVKIITENINTDNKSDDNINSIMNFVFNNSIFKDNKNLLFKLILNFANDLKVPCISFFYNKYPDIVTKAILNSKNNLQLLYLCNREALRKHYMFPDLTKKLNFYTFLINYINSTTLDYWCVLEILCREENNEKLKLFLQTYPIPNLDVFSIFIKNVCTEYTLNFCNNFYSCIKYGGVTDVKHVYLSSQEVLKLCEMGISPELFKYNHNEIITTFIQNKQKSINEFLKISDNNNCILFNLPKDIIHYIVKWT